MPERAEPAVTNPAGARFSGPAVMFGDPQSLFPALLADAWRLRRVPSVLVSAPDPLLPPSLGMRILGFGSDRGPIERVCTSQLRRALFAIERLAAKAGHRRFVRMTGRRSCSPWETHFVGPALRAKDLAMAALRHQPRFVFGHEVHAFGTATALCRGIPRILFPWGNDILNAAETSLAVFLMVRSALRTVDLVVPSSTTAARHLVSRFRVQPERVQAIPWGIRHDVFARADPAARASILGRFGIPRDALVVLNCRRFLPLWGCFDALEAFVAVASVEMRAHFVLIGGQGTEATIATATRSIDAAGLAHRFTVLTGQVPIETYAEIASVSDVALSLAGRGDMRSWSVIQLASAGAALVVARSDEHELMVQEGLSAALVTAGDVEEARRAILALLRDPTRRSTEAAANRSYTLKAYDEDRQMDVMLRAIDAVCRRYGSSAFDDLNPPTLPRSTRADRA